jgi:photosystem II stability/assembly factor-like uncharacterized protein
MTIFGYAGAAARAQVDVQDAHITVSLRGVDAAAPGVAWASGSDGTILRTEDGGYVWQLCAVPPGGAKLDFRGVQAFDAKTAVIMSSGPGDQSKIFKTTDGCQTWKMVFDDPDENGFFDALRHVTSHQMYLMGDPINGKFAMFFSPDAGSSWFIADDPGLEAEKGAGAFAASNSSLTSVGNVLIAGTGGSAGAAVYATYGKCPEGAAKDAACPIAWVKTAVPMAGGSAGAGVFSVAARTATSLSGIMTTVLVAVGGDYSKPDDALGSAAWSKDGGKHWSASEALPGGYRSAVVFDSARQAWLAVGPNGMDISFDDGRHWSPVKASATGPQAGSDLGWNAIAIPFVVGAKGRIGRLRPEVFAH